MQLNTIIKSNWTKAILLTLLLYVVSSVFLGIFYGWLDDIQLAVLYRGLFTPKGLAGPDHHILLAHIFILLYDIAPSVPWYGIIHHLILATGITLMNVQIITVLKKNDSAFYLKLFSIAAFQAIFLVELVSFFNFTYISMFIAIIGLVSATKKLGKASRILGLLMLVLSILIRMEAAIYILPFTGLILLLKNKGEIGVKKFFLPVGAIVITLVVVIIVKKNPSQESLRFLIKNDAVILSIHEANNVNYEWKSAEDSIKVTALTTWNFFDKYEIDEEFLYKISDGFYSKKVLSKYFKIENIRSKLNLAYKSSFRYGSEYNGYNWHWKFLIIGSSILVLLILFLFSSNNYIRFRAFRVLLVFLLWLLSLVILAIVLKLEDRIIFPTLFLFGYFTIELLLQVKLQTKRDKLLSIVMLVTLIFCTVFQIARLDSFAVQKKTELEAKRNIVAEINAFNDKTFLFDFHSIYLMHDTPFKEIKLNKSNEYRVAAHYWLLAFNELQEFYTNLCGSDRIDKIMQYYYQNKEDVILVEHNLNHQILQDYLSIVYGNNYAFRVLDANTYPAISNIKYSYIRYPLMFNYFVFE